MSRKRWISTELSTDPNIGELFEQCGSIGPLLYVMAIPHANDSGVVTGDARTFRLVVCPALRVPPADIEEALNAIASVGLWDRRTIDGEPVIVFEQKRWKSWQRSKPAVRIEFQRLRSRLWKQVAERDPVQCRYCGRTERIELDHITPLAKGGANEVDNLQFLCKPCNRRKGIQA